MIMLIKPKAKPVVAAPPPPPPPATPKAAGFVKKPTAQVSTPAQAGANLTKSGFKFLKRGGEAQKIMAQEEKKAEIRAAQRAMQAQIPRRYWIPAGGTGCVTFLDGDLKDGVLDIPYCWEHQVMMNGHRRNWFVCTQDEEPCPICEAASGGDRSQYVGYLTVIDHSEWKSKDNVVYKDQVRLFAAKKDTVKLLQGYAVKRGGLRGCKFDVVRVGDKSASVGSGFDFTEKYTDAQLQQMYGKIKVKVLENNKPVEKIVDHSKPINYDWYLETIYQPAEELRKLGFGSLGGPIGSEQGAQEGAGETAGEGGGYDM
jgi:hypothetical protein